MNEQLYTPRQLAKLFGVTTETLIQWDKQGKVESRRTPGGHRRYVLHAPPLPVGDDKHTDRKSYIYARVSSAKQKDDLERQVALLQSKFPDHQLVQDVGSGINFKRRGLLTLLDLVIGGRVQEVVVAHRDRLTRFGFDLFEHLFDRCGASIKVLADQDDHEPVNELAKDLLSIVTVFTARYYGSRSYAHMQKGAYLPNSAAGRVVQQVPRRIKVLLQPRSRRHSRARHQRSQVGEVEASRHG